MKTMPQAVSEHSRLRPQRHDYETRNLDHILEDVEQRVRLMCRVMQVFRYEGAGKLADLERDFEDRGTALEVLYEYVDQQMDTISELRADLDKIGWISIAKLREAFND